MRSVETRKFWFAWSQQWFELEDVEVRETVSDGKKSCDGFQNWSLEPNRVT